MSEIAIRRATKSDAAALAKLLREVGEVHAKGRPDIYCDNPAKFDESSAAELIGGSGSLVMVAEADGNVVGETICRIVTRKGDGFYRPRKWLYVDDLCVTESMRGSYAAEKLMKADTNKAEDYREYDESGLA